MMENLIDQIKSFVEQVEKVRNIEKIQVITKYVNINDENDIFLNLDEALAKGLNLAEYQKVVIKIDPKEELTKILTSEPHLLKEDIVLLEKAVKYAKKLVFKPIPEISEKLVAVKDQPKSKRKLKK